ncbi:hypothetical protein L1987_03535 [Smallanthus sonchifolius]|uniref:Uncharacterized protein n=1 Tax=Smallanthus sonchifolius TaxID=185202 RepID=A0ACB9KAT6_9ASTR|nr:hypothetical protein L1987_03535 [Smallanthus sonchifolius]
MLGARLKPATWALTSTLIASSSPTSTGIPLAIVVAADLLPESLLFSDIDHLRYIPTRTLTLNSQKDLSPLSSSSPIPIEFLRTQITNHHRSNAYTGILVGASNGQRSQRNILEVMI